MQGNALAFSIDQDGPDEGKSRQLCRMPDACGIPSNKRSIMTTFKPKGWMFAVGGIALVVLLIIVGFAKVNSVQKTSIDKETQLNAQYEVTQIKYSNFRTGFYEQLGIAREKSDKLDAILFDAIRGRYDGKTSAQPGQGSLFSAIYEAYPDLTQLNIYDRIVDYIQAGRTAFSNDQSKLRDMLRDYNSWRKSGMIHRIFVGWAGAPTDALEARVNGKVLRGQAALDQMSILIVSGETSEIFESGEDKPVDISPTK